MTNLEMQTLNTLAKRLHQLSSLDRACFSCNDEEDLKIKKTIRPYMMWFESVAFDLERVVELSSKSGPCKKYELEEILRLNL